MTTRFKVRRDLAATWTTANPILAAGEPGLETDTRRVKYGDGVTHWIHLNYAEGGSASGDLAVQFEDGVNTNTWRMVTVQGSREFDYVTPGHQYIVIANTQTLVDSATYVVDLTGRDTTLLDLSISENSNIYYYVNNDWNNRVGVSAVKDGTVYTFTTQGANINIASGDEMTIEYWTRGTQYQYPGFADQNGLLANNTSTSTNTIVFDNADWEINNIDNYLALNTDKHYVIFNDYFNEDVRRVTNVTRDVNTFTITFAGEPRAVAAPSVKTFTTTPTNAGTDSTFMTISHESNPDLVNVMYSYQNTAIQDRLIAGVVNGLNLTVTIDGGEPVTGYWSGNYDSRDNYEIYLSSNATWTSTSTVVVNFEDQGTQFDLDIFITDPNWNGFSNGHHWFDWRTDLDQIYVDAPGNGVQSGRMMLHYKVYNLEDKESDHGTMMMDWVNDSNNYFNPRDNDGENPYNYTERDNYPLDNFDANGISFASYWGNWADSKNLKVRIMYKFELVITESNVNSGSGDWFDC